MASILVIGASQGVGRETVKALLADGHRVRAFARSASKLAIADERLEKRNGDALNAGDVSRALEGVDAVVQALGVSFGFDMVVKGTTLFSRATRILVDGMRASGCRRLVAVTGIGAGDSRGRLGFLYDGVMFPLILKRVYDDKDIEEQIIKASGLDWTIVRPGILTDGAASGRYRASADPKDWRAAPIPRADVGRFIADEIRDGTFIGRTPVVIA
jgi:putative NADH-flavin reductase